MANETQDAGRRPPVPPNGSRSSGVAAVALGLAALIAAWFAVTVAYNLAWNYSGWDYLAAGLTLGAIAGLLLWGPVLQMHHVVTGQLPTGTTMLIIAVVCFLLMLAAVVVAGEYGHSQTPLTMG